MNLSFMAYPVWSEDAPVCAHGINTRLHNMLLTRTSVAGLDPCPSPRVFGWTADTITSVMSSAALNAASEKISTISPAFTCVATTFWRLHAAVVCFALDIVTTGVCRFDPRTQEFQALTGMPGHALTSGRVVPLHPCARCRLFIA